MSDETRFVVVVHWDTPLGASLLDAFAQPGGAVRKFVAGQTVHPVIVCAAMDASGVPGFVRLEHLRDWPQDNSARQLLWVPAQHIVLALEIEGDRIPPGFVQTDPDD